MDNLQLQEWLQYVYRLLATFRSAKQDDWQTFINELNKIDKNSILVTLAPFSNSSEEAKVRKIRADIVRMLVKKSITMDDVEKIKQEEIQKHDNKILKSRKNFSILYALYYEFHKEKVNKFFQELQNNLITDLWLQEIATYKVVDFNGAQNFWLDDFWTAIYNQSHKSQKTGLQLNISSFWWIWKSKIDLLPTTISIWLWHWPEYTGSIVWNEQAFDVDTITYEWILNMLKQYTQEIVDDVFVNQTSDWWVKYWLYSPWEQWKKWNEFFDKSVIAIWWDELWDVSWYENKKAIETRLKEIGNTNNSKRNDATANYEFCNEMNVWDVVITKKGKKTYLGYWIVEWWYEYVDSENTYKSRRKMRWIKRWERIEKANWWIVLKTLTDITKYPEYVAKIKELLWITETDFTSFDNNQMSDNQIPLNTILYWVPWTWKTYATINYAVAVVENKPLEEIEQEAENNRIAVKQRFEEYKEKWQIVFTTFHQSYWYEDFVEGIRADVKNNGMVSYSVHNGILKEISSVAENNYKLNKETTANSTAYLDELIRRFSEYIEETQENMTTWIWISSHIIDWKPVFWPQLFPWEKWVSKEQRIISDVLHKWKWWKISSFLIYNWKSYQALGTETIRRDYANFLEGLVSSRNDIKPTKQSTSWQHWNADYLLWLYKLLRDFDISNNISANIENEEQKNYVLIIDEINRGNISKIFWELITLIEDDKRWGAKEALTVMLPYSKEPFSIPSNLYLLWTMNTADRSIALMDLALRRRFYFEEVHPDSELLKDIIVDSINIQQLFETINNRIEYLYDKDHRLWHAFFLPLKDNPTLQHLHTIFLKRVIPLLQEYFYDDYEKIQIVLWDHDEQRKSENDKFIQKQETLEKNVLWFDYEWAEETKASYTINPALTNGILSPEAYKRIYQTGTITNA